MRLDNFKDNDYPLLLLNTWAFKILHASIQNKQKVKLSTFSKLNKASSPLRNRIGSAKNS